MTEENKRSTGRIKSKIMLPEWIWAALLTSIIAGAGSMIGLWRSNEKAVLESSFRIQKLEARIEQQDRDHAELKQRIRDHAELGGHPQLDTRVDSIRLRFDALNQDFRSVRAEQLGAIKELRGEFRATMAEVRADIKALSGKVGDKK